MNKYELIRVLSSSPENEVYIKADDGLLDDIEIEHVEEQFDGFDTVSPPRIALKRKITKDNEERQW